MHAISAAQLDNIEDTLGMINYEMHNAEEELENLQKCCGLCVLPWDQYVCLAEMEPGLRVTGHRVSDFGRVRSGHGSVIEPDPMFEPVLSFNMRVYRGVVSTE